MKKLSVYSSCVTASAGLLLIVGCTVGPKYTRPQVPAPPAFRGADEAPVVSDPKDSIGDQQWSVVFREPELQELIRAAILNNFDTRIAAQRVLESEAQVSITRSQQFPQLTIGGLGAGAALPASVGQSLGNPFVLGSLSATASWTPDFWGLYRKQTEAARDQLLAQQWAQRAVRLGLVQQVATVYFQLRALDRQLEIAHSTLATRQDSLKLTQTLERRGAAPLADVRQAEQLLYTATSVIPQIEEQIQRSENAMRLLLGQTPGPVAHTDPSALVPPPENPPMGLPSQLLERRPDIQRAEAQLKAANAQVGVARAQFFPQVTITGSAGFGGDQISNLFNQSGKTIYGLGSVTQAIFEGGRLRGQYDLTKREKDEMILSYQKTITVAFRDVSDALISANKRRATREQQELLVASAKDATRLARIRYGAGSASYLEVLTTDSNLFSAQLTFVTAQQNEALSLVQLYSALGGGWQ
ncbi:MAG TPA: efflux transporter outer membrane subunit [Acidisarcina sp.]